MGQVVLEECDGLEALTHDTRGILDPETGHSHFELQLRHPDPRLVDHVDCHWTVRWDLRGRDPFVQEILPNPCVNLSSEPGLIAVYGIPLERSPHRIEGSGMVVGTKFRPGGFAGFIGGSVSELNDRIVPLGEALGSGGARLERELVVVAGDEEAHIEAVESFLLQRTPPPDPAYDVVRASVEAMLSAPPDVTVAEIAAGQSVSPRTLQRHFRHIVGVGPKWVLKRHRMHVAAERIASGEADDLGALALDLGYYDQAHFTRDFTAQIGQPPGLYAQICAAAAGRTRRERAAVLA